MPYKLATKGSAMLSPFSMKTSHDIDALSKTQAQTDKRNNSSENQNIQQQYQLLLNENHRLKTEIHHERLANRKLVGAYRGIRNSGAFRIGVKILDSLGPFREAGLRSAHFLQSFRMLGVGLFTKKPPRPKLPILCSKNYSQNISFCSVVTESFIPGLECLLSGLIKYNPGFDFPFIIFHTDLSAGAKKCLQRCYTKIRFQRVDESKYARVRRHERLGFAPYYGIEAFSLIQFDRIIFLDADLLCLGRVDELVETRCDFGACLNISMSPFPEVQNDTNNYIFNTGMLVIGKKYLTGYTYKKLLQLANSEFVPRDLRLEPYCDQRILNVYFGTKDIHFFPSSYNALKRLENHYAFFRLSNVVFLHFVGFKPWLRYESRPEFEQGYERMEQLWWRHYEPVHARNRLNAFSESGAEKKIRVLRGQHKNKRCFILGNGPSLKNQDLTLLKDEITFVVNWFGLHSDFFKIDPNYYCVCSHNMFGGWGAVRPKIESKFQKLIQSTPKSCVKFFSFEFKPYIEKESLFPDHEIRYLLFEKPFKKFVSNTHSFSLNPLSFLNDANTVVLTFCVPLAVYMGFSEIYLLGCDCDMGLNEQGRPLNYFYNVKHHTPQTRVSGAKHLEQVWGEEGNIFQTYDLVQKEVINAGVKIYNATSGGRLEVLPRVRFESLFNTDLHGKIRYPHFDYFMR